MGPVFYRFMFLDSTGHVFHREELTLSDDVTAVEKAAALAIENTIEIWDGRRRVAVVKKGDRSLAAYESGSL